MKSLLLLTILLSSFLSFAQSEVVIIPGHSISGIPAIVDSTTIDDFLARSSISFDSIDNGYWKTYRSKDSTLEISLPKVDLNRIVRKIRYTPSKIFRTTDGFISKESTGLEMDDFYDNTRFSYGRIHLPGMTFLFNGKEDTATLKGILLENDDDLYHRPNFLYDYSAMMPVIDSLLTLVSAKTYSKKDLQSCLTHLTQEQDHFRISAYEDTERSLDSFLTQRQIEISTIGRSLTINIISKSSNASIIYARLASTNSVFHETDLIADLVDTYQSKSLSKIRFEIKSLNDQQTFGFGCSVSGSPPALCLSMYDLVKKRDFTTLVTWAQSLNPENMAYGYIGLKWLSRKNKTKQRKYQAIFQKIEVRNPQLYSCSGCSYSSNLRLKDHYSFNHWKSCYKGAKATGWLTIWPK